jgi:hypothetical protein
MIGPRSKRAVRALQKGDLAHLARRQTATALPKEGRRFNPADSTAEAWLNVGCPAPSDVRRAAARRQVVAAQ